MTGIRFVGDAANDSNSDDFAMYSPEANALVAKVVGLVSMGLNALGAETAAGVLKDSLAEIALTYAEVGDTMVRETIFSAMQAQWLMLFGETATLAGAL